MIGDQRDLSIPPCDCLAEQLCLDRMTWQPDMIDHYDLGPLLRFPEHQEIWRAMVRVHMRYPYADYGVWYCHLVYETDAYRPGLLNVLDCARPVAFERAIEEARQAAVLRDDAPPAGELVHGFRYWFARLRRLADCRRVISLNQQSAELAWKGDLDGALAVTERIRLRSLATAVIEV